MWYWLGIFLLISGTLSLIFNEFTVRVRRIWPWRRDDSDPVRDEELKEFYRFSIYAGSIASIEIGAVLADIALPHLVLRVVAYLCFGAWLIWRRPVMRTRRFWLSIPYRGKRRRS
jgi:hypothetical protein